MQGLEYFKPLPACLNVRASKLDMDKVVVPSEPPSPSHQMTLVPQGEEGEVANLPIKLPPPPTPPALDFCIDFDCKPDGCHMVSTPRTPSNGSFDPLYFDVLCSSILDSTCDVHENQVMDEVRAGKPTYAIIFNEYVWEFEQEFVVKDFLLLSAPHLIYPDIFCDSAISNFSYENLSLNVSVSA